jgi:hypothetical protein
MKKLYFLLTALFFLSTSLSFAQHVRYSGSHRTTSHSRHYVGDMVILTGAATIAIQEQETITADTNANV